MEPLLMFPLTSKVSLLQLGFLLLVRGCHSLRANLCFKWLLQEQALISLRDKAEGELSLLEMKSEIN